MEIPQSNYLNTYMKAHKDIQQKNFFPSHASLHHSDHGHTNYLSSLFNSNKTDPMLGEGALKLFGVEDFRRRRRSRENYITTTGVVHPTQFFNPKSKIPSVITSGGSLYPCPAGNKAGMWGDLQMVKYPACKQGSASYGSELSHGYRQHPAHGFQSDWEKYSGHTFNKDPFKYRTREGMEPRKRHRQFYKMGRLV